MMLEVRIKLRNLVSVVTVFSISLLVAISCTPQQSTSNSSPSSSPTIEVPVNIGFTAWPGSLPWQISQEEKLFEANKIKANLKWFDGYLDSIKALIAGHLHGNNQTLNDTLSSLAEGSDQVIVLVNDNSTGNDKIIVRQGINSIADLKGKKIAAEEGTVDHFLLLLGLKKVGLTQKDINFQPLETSAAAAAFAAGKLDAVGVFTPFTTQALKRAGSKELFTSKDFPGAISDHLAVSRKLINERPQDVQKLVDTWFATLDYIKKNPDKAYKIMAKRVGISVKEYKDYDAGIKIFTIEDNLKAFASGKDMSSLQFAAGEISKFLVESSLAKQTPNLSKLFDDRFVKAYAAKMPK